MSILVSPDRERLLAGGLAVEASTTHDFVRVHRRLLTDVPDTEHPNLPLVSHRSVRPEYQAQFFCVIPETLISKATIRYFGLVPLQAEKIWLSWCRGPGRRVPWDSNHRLYGHFFVDCVLEALMPAGQPRLFRNSLFMWRLRMLQYGIDDYTQRNVLEQACRCLHHQTSSQQAQSQSSLSNHSESFRTTAGADSSGEMAPLEVGISCEHLLTIVVKLRFWFLERAMNLSENRADALRDLGPELAKLAMPPTSGSVLDGRLYSEERAPAPVSDRQVQ